MKHYLILFIAAVAMLMTSCASQRALMGDVQVISAHLDAEVKCFNLDEGCNGNIKMKRGEAIQISLTKMGIEGVRIILTPDSILFVNKLAKVYLRTSFRDADKALGGEGTLTFRNVEAYFWNDYGNSPTYATLPIAGFVPLEIKTSYSRRLRVGQYSLPQRIHVNITGDDGAIQTGDAKLKLTKVQVANGWTPNTEIPAKYKNLNFITVIKNLLKK